MVGNSLLAMKSCGLLLHLPFTANDFDDFGKWFLRDLETISLVFVPLPLPPSKYRYFKDLNPITNITLAFPTFLFSIFKSREQDEHSKEMILYRKECRTFENWWIFMKSFIIMLEMD